MFTGTQLRCFGWTCLSVLAFAAPEASAQLVSRVSVSAVGREATQRHLWSNYYTVALSGDGRFVAFRSSAAEFHPRAGLGDKLFFFDRWSHGIEIAVTSPATGAPLDNVGIFSLSFDGRWVAFDSTDSRLHAAPANGFPHCYVLDRSSGVIELLSRGISGSPGNGHSGSPSISRDGSVIVFSSAASDLVAGDTNRQVDVFCWRRGVSGLARVSLGANGVQGDRLSNIASVSGDGRYVVYRTGASTIVPGIPPQTSQVVRHDLASGFTELVSVNLAGLPSTGASIAYSISDDGRFVCFDSNGRDLVPNINNYAWDVFVRDMLLGRTVRVSVDSNGGEGNNDSNYGMISGDGRWVTFHSDATNWLFGPGASGLLFRHEMATGNTEIVSRDAFGAMANHVSFWSSPSRDGSVVAFDSAASNLVPDDRNGVQDLFVRDVACPSIAGAYGSACAGSNGIAPLLYLAGCPTRGQDVLLWVRGALPYTMAAVIFGALRGNIPIVGSRCELLVDAFLPVVSLLPVGAEGHGSLGFRLPPIPGLIGDFTVQAMVLDPGLGASFSTTRGIEVRVR